MSRSRFCRVAPIAVLVATLSLISACDPSARGARQGTTPAGSSAAATTVGAQALYSYFPATGAQLSVGAQFAGTMKSLREGIIAKCLAQYGFKLPQNSRSSNVATFFDNSDFPDLDKISRTGVLVEQASIVGPNTSVPAAQRSAYQADAKRCGAQANKPFAPLIKLVGALEPQWQQIMSGVQSSAPVLAKLAGFRTCMQEAGAPAWVLNRGTTSAHALGGFLAWETGAESQAKTDAARLAVDRRWAGLFVRCATPTIKIQNGLLLARQKAFFQDHYEEVHTLQNLAPQIVSAVERQYGMPGS